MKNGKKQVNIKLRYNAITTSVYIVGLVLLMQLFNLQIIHGNEYRETSNTRLSRESTLKAARGNICDNSGTPLVTTTTSFSLEMYKSKIDTDTLNDTILKAIRVLEEKGDSYVDNFPISMQPFAFKQGDEEKEKKWKQSNKIDENATAEEVVNQFKEKYKIKNENMEEVRKIIAIRYQIIQEGYSSTKSIRIADNISRESAIIFNEQNEVFPGMNTVVDPVRFYPKGTLASHIVGYTGKIGREELDNEKENGYTQLDFYGKAGIEKIAEKYLKGKDGTKQIDMAVDGTITDEYISKEAEQGANVILTIDANLQAVTEKALAENIDKIRNGGFSDQSNATGGAMVVMNVKTGEILAMASNPDYEPSKFTFGIDQATWDQYKGSNMKNRAIQEAYPPGSIFKMVTATAGLETGAIDTKAKINDIGIYPYDGNPKCWLYTSNRRGHGWLNVSGAIQHSCNYFFYEIGHRIGIEALEKYTRYYGLGSKTGIELPAEAAGSLNHKEEGKVWYPGDTLSAAIGQKDNNFTPVQMVKYASMLANGGKVVNPTIVKSIKNADGTEVPRAEYENYFNEKLGLKQEQSQEDTLNPNNLKAILEGMRSVTSESGGTAYSTFKNFNIEVGGKTGSAQTGKIDENGKRITHAWFLGFAPFEDPEIAIIVVVENGGHGGYTAEAARDVMKQYFGMNSNQVTEDVNAKPYTEVPN